jgi:hypothetical protein
MHLLEADEGHGNEQWSRERERSRRRISAISLALGKESQTCHGDSNIEQLFLEPRRQLPTPFFFLAFNILAALQRVSRHGEFLQTNCVCVLRVYARVYASIFAWKRRASSRRMPHTASGADTFLANFAHTVMLSLPNTIVTRLCIHARRQ